jgi:NADPH:quinone reductase-like Zn-dependent oxidoreductase
VKAIAFSHFGGPEVLGVVDLPEPHAGPGEVRLSVAAAAVNPTDTGLRAGLNPRPFEYPPPYVVGMDAAGIIDEVGEGAPWSVGDQVMAIVLPTGPHGGAYASQVVVPADSVARIPANSTLVEASTLPMNGLTARLSLDQLGLQAGQTLAVTGAAGAYGGYVIQLAKHDGLRVIADAAEADEPLVRSFGADVIVRRGDDVAERIREIEPKGVDGVADGAVLEGEVLPAIKDGGGLAVVRGWTGPTERGIELHQTRVYSVARDHGALDRLREQVEAGELTLRVAATFGPADAAEAHRRLEAGGVRGRLVISFR